MGNSHQIPCECNGQWVGMLWNRGAKGAGRPPCPHPELAPLLLAVRPVAEVEEGMGLDVVVVLRRGIQLLEHVAAWIHEGALLFVAGICCNYKDSTYKRELERDNDRRPSSKPA